MNILEIAVRKLVPALVIFGLFIILPQMPFAKFRKAVLFDKLPLSVPRRPMVGPIAGLVQDKLEIRYELLCFVHKHFDVAALTLIMLPVSF